MASSQLNPAPHQMAKPGYGKRSTPDQLTRTANDFAHLPPREAAIAAYLDRVPDGTDISVKTLAKVLPYGQCALRTALNHLQRAGHLRRGSEHVIGSGSARWVTRTWFTRTARDDTWWAAFSRGDVPKEPSPRPTRSRAYILLAALGRTTPAMSLSAADCVELEPLVDDWFSLGATAQEVLHALTGGLPTPVHKPVSLARRRLSKLPPDRTPQAPPRPVLRALECALCGVPGPPEALPGGTCAECRGEPAPVRDTGGLSPAEVRTRAAEVRAAATRPTERTRA
ncbi:hypothetical protein ABCR94_01575 [Streptomyces sp. 21So2-11]|uniref:hypothetical protein n=1 Tax=Streptomyces sp. 21So2-11 TaxID=3144408 RepID=UPI0032199D7A